MVAASIEDSTEDQSHRVFEVNVLGPFLGTRAVTPLMRKAGGGSNHHPLRPQAATGELDHLCRLRLLRTVLDAASAKPRTISPVMCGGTDVPFGGSG
jgi:NAD(P)-dependent dehydrogenase (short-subunit alcohol dehydrogenase family)